MNINLLIFFIFTYLLSWIIWIPLAIKGESNQLLFWLAGFAPTLTAVLMTLSQNSWIGFRNLFCMGWRIKPAWYLISLLGAPLVMLASLGIHVALGGDSPQYLDPNHLVTSFDQLPLIIVVFLYVFIFTALGEEVGWRAYALPHLQARITPFVSSLILGFLWALWHLPLFLMDGNFHQQLPVSWFIMQVLGSTFIYTWMFNRAGGNLLVALLFHTSSNAAVGLLPVLPLDNGGSLRPLWIAIILLWLAVGWVLWFDRRVFFEYTALKSGN